MRRQGDAGLGAAGRPTRWWVGLAGSGVVAQHSYTKTDPPTLLSFPGRPRAELTLCRTLRARLEGSVYGEHIL